jgi:phosphoribosylaminoimidazole-succinocarboxamide synthase
LSEGKTKKIYRVKGNPNLVIIKNKNDITKNDDPTQTREMRSKAEIATETTCIIFEVLKRVGIPVAYQERISDTEFVATKCKMIGLEVIDRRYAVGSFLSRYPTFATDKKKTPYCFEQWPRFEVFLKTTGGVIVSKDGKEIGRLPNDSKTRKPIEDPFIFNPEESQWIVKNPKIWIGDKDSNLCTLFPGDILPKGISIKEIKKITDKTCFIVETFVGLVGLILIDFKIEFGMGPNGELLIADVFDADSCRIRTYDWRELSKELFRQNKDMKEIKDAYEYILRKLREAMIIVNKKQRH